MAAIQESAFRTAVLVLSGTSELNSLANNNVGAITGTGSGTVLDNTGNKDIVCVFELQTGTLGAGPTAGAVFELHMYPSFDGANYATSLSAGATLPNDPPIGLFVVNGTGTSQRLPLNGGAPVTIPPGKYKFALVNRCGQALPASGAAVNAYAFSYTSI
jgi:hypothetical protein